MAVQQALSALGVLRQAEQILRLDSEAQRWHLGTG
jgi:hypothetical protein